MDQDIITVNGCKTRIIQAGSGPSDIVLIHAGAFSTGPVCHNALAWELNMPGLARSYRVSAFDLLGQGRTDQPSDGSDYTYDAVAAHAQATIDALGIRRAHIVAHDHGAITAVSLAFAQPELVASCTIVGSPTLTPSGDNIPNRLLDGPLEPRSSREGQRWAMDRQSFTTDHLDRGRFLDEAASIGASDGFRRAQAHFTNRQPQDISFERSLDKIKIQFFARIRDTGFPTPLLFLNGNQDPTFSTPNAAILSAGMDLWSPAAYARQMFTLVAPKQEFCQFKLVNQAGYWFFREKPEKFNQVISGYIEGVEGV